MRKTRARPTRGLMALVALAVAATGCGPVVQQPEIRLDSVRLGALGLQGGTLNVRLEVVNPNRFGIETSGLTYSLDLQDGALPNGDDAWLSFASGTLDEAFRIGPRDTAVVEVPLEFRFRDAGPAVRSILTHGTFDYRISGTVSVERPVRRQLPYRRTGTVSLLGES